MDNHLSKSILLVLLIHKLMLTTDVCVSSGGRLRRMESGERENGTGLRRERYLISPAQQNLYINTKVNSF